MTEGSDDKDPRKHLLALDHHPELAREVGLILSAFAILELVPIKLLSKIAHISEANSETLSAQFRSFGSRITMLEALIKTKNQNCSEILSAIEIISRLKVCAEIRNKYAHGLWTQIMWDDHAAVRLTNWLPDARNSIATIVDEESIKNDCATLREALYHSINYSGITIRDVDIR